jgi:hypothetical protein
MKAVLENMPQNFNTLRPPLQRMKMSFPHHFTIKTTFYHEEKAFTMNVGLKL